MTVTASQSPALPYSYAKQHQVLLIPHAEADALYECVYRNTPDVRVMNELHRLAFAAQKRLVFKAVTEEDFQTSTAELYRDQSEFTSEEAYSLEESSEDLQSLSESMAKTHDLLSDQDDAPVIRLLNAVLTEALNAGASDIHIETFKDALHIRFRVDGVLRHALTPPLRIAQRLVSRVKVMSRLDIAEKRIPQDGRMAVEVAGNAVNVRVSTLPTHHGERIVLRLLDEQFQQLTLERLGASEQQTSQLKRLLESPHGIVLVTGPTGSGKTTTLYASLSHLNDGEHNILTIEDPVEYDVPGIGQSQVDQKSGMTFARGLRAILRQDPDVVMVGEIRDQETADIAIQASMTGHLVLATLHTNTATGAVTRLLDIGIEPFLLSSSLLGSIAQRLVRVLCEHCKVAYSASDIPQLTALPETPKDATVYRAVGCRHCGESGYSGRTALYEIIPIDAELRGYIHAARSEVELTQAAHRRNASLLQAGLAKVLEGVTSIEEVMRVTAGND